MNKSDFELLLPVGNTEMALAAIHNGADAIYLGFPGFNARGRTLDLDLATLKEIIQTCHLYGVRVHVALNILIFESEFQKLIGPLKQVIALSPDSFIVQDIGLAQLIRAIAPQQAIHASTQMTITNHDAIELMEDLNFKRVVLGRENSIDEIKIIRQHTNLELEVFVHGALCVAYSGQCFTSESLGGRSANRGQCAQSCRFAYDLIVDGAVKTSLDKEYLLSPRDLCGIAEIPTLMDIGVNSFKVEGRLKGLEYVAEAAREYRQVIDQHILGANLTDDQAAGAKLKMGTTYSRGFYSGWLHGVDHQQLVDGTFCDNRGAEIAELVKIVGDTYIIELKQKYELQPGDGLVFAAKGGKEEYRNGAQIYEVYKGKENLVELKFAKIFRLGNEFLGAKVYLNKINALDNDLNRSIRDKSQFKKIPVTAHLKIEINKQLSATLSNGQSVVAATTDSLIQPARNAGVTDQFLRDELSALGGTVFTLQEITIERAADEAIFISHKEIKELRRKLTDQLTTIRSENRIDLTEVEIVDPKTDQNFNAEQNDTQNDDNRKLRFNVLLRNKGQVEDLIEALEDRQLSKEDFDSIILDFEFGLDHEPSYNLLKTNGIKVGIATTRILKPKEYFHLKLIERLNPDVILVRNLGALNYFRSKSSYKGELRGDFSLNVANHLTANYLLSKGLSQITASYDLNFNQVSELLNKSDASKLEITAHQYMPSFHMEHCVFAAFLSTGSSFRDCGRPCEKHDVQLRDQFGNMHFIKPDQECRNTMFKGTAISAARYLPAWRRLGLGSIRLEALNERKEQLIRKIKTYALIAKTEVQTDNLISELGVLETYGLGEGPISREQEYISRKK